MFPKETLTVSISIIVFTFERMTKILKIHKRSEPVKKMISSLIAVAAVAAIERQC